MSYITLVCSFSRNTGPDPLDSQNKVLFCMKVWKQPWLLRSFYLWSFVAIHVKPTPSQELWLQLGDCRTLTAVRNDKLSCAIGFSIPVYLLILQTNQVLCSLLSWSLDLKGFYLVVSTRLKKYWSIWIISPSRGVCKASITWTTNWHPAIMKQDWNIYDHFNHLWNH